MARAKGHCKELNKDLSSDCHCSSSSSSSGSLYGVNPSTHGTCRAAINDVSVSQKKSDVEGFGSGPGQETQQESYGEVSNLIDVIELVRQKITEGEIGIGTAVQVVQDAIASWRVGGNGEALHAALFLTEQWRGVFEPKPWEKRIVFPSPVSLERILLPSSSFNEVEAAFCECFVERYRQPYAPSGRMSALRTLVRLTDEAGGRELYLLPLRAVALLDIHFLCHSREGELDSEDERDMLDGYDSPHPDARGLPLRTSVLIWQRLSSSFQSDSESDLIQQPLESEVDLLQRPHDAKNRGELLVMRDKSNARQQKQRLFGICKAMELTCTSHVLEVCMKFNKVDLLLKALQTVEERIAEAERLGLQEEVFLGFQDLALVGNQLGIHETQTGEWTIERCLTLLIRVICFCNVKGYHKWGMQVYAKMEDVAHRLPMRILPGLVDSLRFQSPQLKIARKLADVNPPCLEALLTELGLVCNVAMRLYSLELVDRGTLELQNALRLFNYISHQFGDPSTWYPLEVTGLLWAERNKILGMLVFHHGSVSADTDEQSLRDSLKFYRNCREAYHKLRILTLEREATLLMREAVVRLKNEMEGHPPIPGPEDLEELMDTAMEKAEEMGRRGQDCSSIHELIAIFEAGLLRWKGEKLPTRVVTNLMASATIWKDDDALHLLAGLHDQEGEREAAVQSRVVAMTWFQEQQTDTCSLSDACLSRYGEMEADVFRHLQLEFLNHLRVGDALIWNEWSRHRFLSTVLIQGKSGTPAAAAGAGSGGAAAATAAAAADVASSSTGQCSNKSSELPSEWGSELPSEWGSPEETYKKLLSGHFESDKSTTLSMIMAGCRLCGPRTALIEYVFWKTDDGTERILIYVMTIEDRSLSCAMTIKDPSLTRCAPLSYKGSEGVEVHLRRVKDLMESDTSLPPLLRDPRRRSLSMKPYLIERHTVATVPGVHLLPLLKERSENLLNMMCHPSIPVSNSEGLAAVGGGTKTEEHSAWKSLIVGDPFVMPEDFDANAIAYAREEAQMIHDMLRPGTATLLTGRHPTKARVMDALACGAPLAHFAAHLQTDSPREITNWKGIHGAEMGIMPLARQNDEGGHSPTSKGETENAIMMRTMDKSANGPGADGAPPPAAEPGPEFWPWSLDETTRRARLQLARSDLKKGEGASDLDALLQGLSNINPLSHEDETYQGPNYHPAGLSAQEILKSFNNDLRTLLVVLSCCDSSKGRPNPDELLNFARAFYVSLVPCVVSSVWKVEDDATFAFMVPFYSALREGKDVSSSLRSAMLSMLYAGRSLTTTTTSSPSSLPPNIAFFLEIVADSYSGNAGSGNSKDSEDSEDKEDTEDSEDKEDSEESKDVEDNEDREACFTSTSILAQVDDNLKAYPPHEDDLLNGLLQRRKSVLSKLPYPSAHMQAPKDEEAEEEGDWDPSHWGAFLSIGLPTLKMPDWLFASST
ncbi:hypothetical protein CBR_g31590 [Chara braunii]|uniref:CHAT domain-containing protein n=1 Tax=Chara braunii TaxID=69332 RepID=A0A388LFF1_CHABU|nr:hypothetical protein CBR_g31590 [Chara braunii]|eukprot:GBG81034.1 hypothetical protein CBR_g31590 [Chara braunii]